MFIETERVGGYQELGAVGKGRDVGQRIPTYSYKMNNFWGSNVQHDNCS